MEMYVNIKTKNNEILYYVSRVLNVKGEHDE